MNWRKYMEQKQNEKQWEPIELLELKVNRYVHDVQEKLDICNISVHIDSKQIETLFNDTIEVDLEEIEAPETTRGSIHVKRDGSGKYYSIKNISFYITDFLELGLNLIQTETKYKIVISAIFLLKLLKQLGVNLEDEQTVVYVALHQAAKHYVITEDNVTECVLDELGTSSYMNLSREDIKNILLKLLDMGIISVENGIYGVFQKLYID